MVKQPTKGAEYAAMVAEAEASVSAVKDPELRRVAFEKILGTLLEGTQARPREQKAARRVRRAAPGIERTTKAKGTATSARAKGSC